jgi:tRNA threonylcarbamoyladenosine biosynthesis protein TsaB
VECYGYGCLSFLAATARSQMNDDIEVDVAIKGGHGEYYFQSFGAEGEAVNPAISVSPQQAALHSTASVIVGDVSEALRDMRGSGDALTLMPDARNFMAVSGVESVVTTPVYVRPPDAKPHVIAGERPPL